jgi:Tol biopolymer transport system component
MRQYRGKISQEGFPLILVIAISTFVALICAPATVGQSNGTTEQIDMSGNGAPANFGSEVGISLSADGRFLAFSSWASNLALDQQAFNFQDIFVRDRVSGATELVSVNSSGVQSDGISIDPVISADGRYVVFTSDATNLVPGDTNQCFNNLLDETARPGDCTDIFVHDRETGLTERVSVSSSGEQANDQSFVPSISADGRYVTFLSMASNLFPNDPPVSVDLFIHDRQTGETERVLSPAVLGDYSITPDARFIAYIGLSSNGYYTINVYDRQTGTNEQANTPIPGRRLDGYSANPVMSADGRFVAYTSSATTLVAGDTNSRRDIFVHDRLTRVTERVSVSSAGAQANGDSTPGFFPSGVAISADGRRVAFSSSATNLAPGDTNTCAVQFYYSFPSPGQCPDIFVRDREAGTTTRASLTFSGAEANNASYRAVMSSDGNVLAYLSLATNLVPGDTSTPSCITFPFRANACQHIFARLTP